MDVIKLRAAEWIARLHAEDCTPLDHDMFRAWLASDPRNGPVFEHLTELWELSGGARTPPVVAKPVQTIRRPVLSRRHALAGLVAAAFLAVPPWEGAHASRIEETGIGSIRDVRLTSRTDCRLDTQTRLVVGANKQQARLCHGQVLLSVAGPDPFHLSADGMTVQLHDKTSADIRINRGNTEVTAIRGKVFLTAAALREAGRWVMPGQRLRMDRNGGWNIDYPDLETLLSWQSGELVFRNQPLAEVIQEINRYTSRQIVLSAPRLASQRLSGVYHVRQGDAFLQMLPHLLPLRIRPAHNAYEIVAL
ncbi:FecR family protein [Gluconobacter kondonii]|uniref:FecR family protein n=1 Tax=Gluconobacter kondonii TaxID=941463 RepID=UPI001B8C1794|nr:DUF4880 domain-containing protein [Gluconobacter kondonii]MBS1054640.1 DUF4880 domain-containing protein [Gluconobacter kondonii]MBS1055837.1 DUF4880 domain-containing protein [Gluconobacter kondonii]